jgi:hypothetical protein
MPWRWGAPFLADSLDGTRVTAIHGARLSPTHVVQTGKKFPVVRITEKVFRLEVYGTSIRQQTQAPGRRCYRGRWCLCSLL